MRILFACEYYHPSVGGVQEVIRQIAERLASRGHDVTVATSLMPSRGFTHLNGVRVVGFKVGGNLVRGMSGDVDSYRSFVLDGDFDVVLIKAAQQWTFDSLWPILDRMTAAKVFIPCGFSALYEPAYADYYALMPDILRRFDQLIFYAEEYRDIQFARAAGIEALTVIPNGADEREFDVERDPAFRRRHGIADDAFLVLTVGSLTGLKGHHELGQAFLLAQFGERRAFLLLDGHAIESRVRRLARRIMRRPLGGRRPTLDWLVAAIERCKPGKRARVVDLPRSELIQAYMNADLFAFASNVEYSPLVLYEAAAAGLPFLSVPVGNAAEIAEWTGGGVICPAPVDERGYTRGDPIVIAGGMAAMASDPDRLRALGEMGRRRRREQFTWETIATRYERVLVEAVETASSREGA